MIGFQDLISALSYRRKLVVAIAATIFIVIFGIALVMPRQYTATSSVLIDLSDIDPATDKNQVNPQEIDTVVGTQVDIMRSTAVLAEAAKRLGMVDSKGNASSRDDQLAVSTLRNPLAVSTDKGSNVIRLYYANEDPAEAARVLNTIVDTFLAKQVQLRTAPAANSAEWYDQRTREVRNRYEAAQSKLADFQRKNGIVGFDRMDVEGDKVKSLSSELARAQADAAVANSRAGTANDPEIAKSTIVQDLEREVGMQSSRVADLSKTLGPNHPSLVAANAQLSQLRSSLASARSGQASSLSSASNSAQRRESELGSRLASQQQKMVSMSAVQDELMILQRDVDAARQTYDMVRQRYNESALRSEISQASASRLDRADIPAFPSRPNLMLWLMAAILSGICGSVGFVAWQEFFSPRVRTMTGTQTMLDTEVLMDLTSLPKTQRVATPAEKEFA